MVKVRVRLHNMANHDEVMRILGESCYEIKQDGTLIVCETERSNADMMLPRLRILHGVQAGIIEAGQTQSV
jgi:hypothetical protein